ncbi:Cytochrome b561, eukaryote [Corchorus olitorius]|uniref:Cytochrome b561, eukaryote n=1 Tax=Corchorus olitorius TaxID=93759 RepID=A0A1R3HQB7_9ROSI|nr:Cytochrome b561, eukaryote [Corchorus olitorius]
MAIKSRSYQVSATPVVVLGQLLIISVATLVFVWILKFREGLAFKSANQFKLFNLHPFLMVIGFILVAGEVFKFQNETDTPDMYTLHSWLGMIAICLFGAQWLLAFFSFIFPRAESSSRAGYRPWHVFVAVGLTVVLPGSY